MADNNVNEKYVNAEWFIELIDLIVNLEGFQYWNIETQNIDTNSSNYLGKLYEVDIKGTRDSIEKEINLFIKKKIYIQTQCVSMANIYNNEKFFYNKLSHVYINIQNQFGVPKEEQFKFAKMYWASDDLIVLENIRKKGFRIYHRMDTLKLPYTLLAIKELAKLHALSFVLEKEMPKFFKECTETLKPVLIFNDEWKSSLHNIIATVINLIDDDSKKEKLINFETVHEQKFPKYQSVDEKRVCCLTHGDYRMSNVMVREVDCIPVEVLPVDYQMMDYGCPIRDLLFFIMTGSDQDFRKRHMDTIKETYFDTMSKYLIYFNMDIQQVYPREEFETSYREWFDYGLMMALFTSVLFFIPEHDRIDQNQSLVDMSFKMDGRGVKRILNLIDDYIEEGYL